MDKKALLAKATEKLERRSFAPEITPEPTPAPPSPAQPIKPPRPRAASPSATQVATPKPMRSATPSTETEAATGNGGGEEIVAETIIEPVVKKGITLRPSNIKKLEALELSLRNRGLKPSQSGLIQIAIDRLEDGLQLEEDCRKLVERDLRFK